MVKVSLVILFGLAAQAALRNRSAALRHLVLAASVVCAAATPALEIVVPSWHLPVSPSLFGRSVEPLTLLIPVSLAQPGDGQAAVGTGGSNHAPHGTAMATLRSLWIVGVGFNLSIMIVGLTRLVWLASRAREITHGTWTEIADALSRRHGLRRPVLLLQSDHPTLLVTWGLMRPKIILPRHSGDWPEARVRVVLGHELAHIQRRDWLVQMTAELLRATYWFNPLVWIACGRLRDESERACDDAVLSLGVEGPDYATHLLALARAFKQHTTSAFPAPAMARPSSLERRVRAMLNTRLNRTPIARSTYFAIAIATLTITVPIAGLVAYAQTGAASFSGSLVDAVGRVLPDVTLVLSNTENSQKHETRSDGTGHFSFAGIPAGDYQLEVQKLGFATSQGRMTLAAGQNLTRDVALQIGAVHETITVSNKPVATVASEKRVRQTQSRPDYDPCSQSTVGGCIKPPMKLKDVKPRYPQGQSDADVAGQIELEGRIGTDGWVKELRLAAPGDPDFANAAVEAVRQWQFTPTYLDAVPVETPIRIRVNFIAAR